MTPGVRRVGLVLGGLGALGVLAVHWMVFFYVGTEQEQGVIQRIFYLHVPTAWVTFFAFGIVALCSAVYLWLGDERADMAAESAAEGGMVFGTVFLLTGSLWGHFSWGAWWQWDARLTSALLLWFVYLGYHVLRRTADSPEQAKRFSAVLGIAGAGLIPFIHMSVYWFRTIHPEPVILNPRGSTADTDMTITILTSFLSFTLLFLGLMAIRYGLQQAVQTLEDRTLARQMQGSGA